jgi:hypothetical protein
LNTQDKETNSFEIIIKINYNENNILNLLNENISNQAENLERSSYFKKLTKIFSVESIKIRIG